MCVDCAWKRKYDYAENLLVVTTKRYKHKSQRTTLNPIQSHQCENFVWYHHACLISLLDSMCGGHVPTPIPTKLRITFAFSMVCCFAFYFVLHSLCVVFSLFFYSILWIYILKSITRANAFIQEEFKHMKYETSTTKCEWIGDGLLRPSMMVMMMRIKIHLPEMNPTLFCIPPPLLPHLYAM